MNYLFYFLLLQVSVSLNNQPVIGILTQSLEKDMDHPDYSEYIMKSYSSFLESSGAQIIPIFRQDPNLEYKLNRVSGVVFPGGDGDYFQAAKHIFNRIKEINKNEYLPLWGICMGYELMLNVSTNKTILEHVPVYHVSLPLQFTVAPFSSQMYSSYSNQQLSLFTSLNLTYNNHLWGVNKTKLENDEELHSQYQVTAVSRYGSLSFVASVEARDYPFWGTQFHPEKSLALFHDGININHSWKAQKVQRMMADKFIALCRKTRRKFKDQYQLTPFLIENYKLLSTASSYGQYYLFK